MRARAIGALWVGVVMAASLAVAAPAAAHPAPERQRVSPLPLQQAIEPPLNATPEADCGPGSIPETVLQGQVPAADHASGRAAKGYTCNTKLVGEYTKPSPQGTVGGFKVERYVDAEGRECAYYDSTLLFPTSLVDTEAGVNVLDMSDPKNPVLTERLVTPAMLSPHESLVVSQQRGVLAAVLGNPATYPGLIDVYDISADCRHPVLKASTPVGVLGHESGMAPDGRTFYSASPGSSTVVAVDISNLSAPVPLWIGPYDSHGLSISADGNRAYVAGIDSGLIILDVSEIQARKPNPQVREIARLQWDSMSIPQNAIPVTIDDHPYVVEIDEFGTLSEVGAGRIIDIADEAHPRVVSNLRLEVHEPENFDRISGDPAAGSPLQGYAGHYCNVPTRVDPGIVACSMILSGLRVFDIRDPKHPREVAYFNAPIGERSIPGFEASNWAMSSPSFNTERGEIWYTDGFQGFFAVKATNGVWPFAKCKDAVSTISTSSKRTVGTSGDDVISGRKARERIAAKGGADKVCSRGDRDRINGGAGKDKLNGGGGPDRVSGGSGNDWVKGGRGRDRLDCGSGRDVAIVNGRDRARANCERVKQRGR
jgi:hypothetical protein